MHAINTDNHDLLASPLRGSLSCIAIHEICGVHVSGWHSALPAAKHILDIISAVQVDLYTQTRKLFIIDDVLDRQFTQVAYTSMLCVDQPRDAPES